ncbi:GNAT family N-acetyltransferase [Salirhabdus sp. Marseille-P4669]|uniref:GNAT family N-acetyltransferase n=1 Tax=Salirhabdus sp. Marseille-P4669 TaxID=2042310 RepID=UPI000C7A8215|nr:GNAT family N-acetyltransferase [Salirhabdus sp. Marseille-P4669]
MLVTVLGEQDAKEYWELRLKALKNHPEAFGTSYQEALNRENPIEQTKKNLTSEESITFGAYDEEKLVGMVTLLCSSREKESHKASIVAMYVDDDYRKNGIGRQLIFKAINTARRLKHVEQLLLQVVSANKPAIKLYESIGFKTYGTEPKALKIDGKYFDEHLMILFL